MIYFDHNATAPVMREARDAWLNATLNIGGNASSPHQSGAAANKAMTDAREKLAAFLGLDNSCSSCRGCSFKSDSQKNHRSPRILLRYLKGFKD